MIYDMVPSKGQRGYCLRPVYTKGPSSSANTKILSLSQMLRKNIYGFMVLVENISMMTHVFGK